MLNTTDFVTAVKRAIGVPTYQGRFSDNDMLALANEEQKIKILPILTSVRENYNVATINITTVAGQAAYRIPARAVGRGVRDLLYRSTDGQNIQNLSQLNLEDAWQFSFNNGTPSYFVLEGDKIVLYPTPQVPAILVCKVVFQLASLVQVTRTAGIASVTDDTLTLASNCPQNITIATGANEVDVTLHMPGYQVLVANAVVTNIANQTVLTLAGFSPTNSLLDYDITQFDIVSTAGETSILQIPDELQPVLIHATAARVLEGLSNPDRLKMQKEKVVEVTASANEILMPRSEGENLKVFPRNGLLRGRRGRQFPRTQI
jgi:hypothetical protein